MRKTIELINRVLDIFKPSLTIATIICGITAFVGALVGTPTVVGISVFIGLTCTLLNIVDLEVFFDA